jgi:hypothetical protein
MSEPPFRISYIVQRDDFVALTRAMNHMTLRTHLFRIALLVGAMTAAWFASTREHSGDAFNEIVTGRAPFEVYPFIAVMLVVLLFALFSRPWLLAWTARRVYPRNAFADKQIVFEITDVAIVGGLPLISSTIAWAAVVRLIETPERLFVAISRREALIIPRRAFASDADFVDFLAFARGRLAATRAVDGTPSSA